MSNQEKIEEIQELLRRERELDLRRDERRGRGSLVEFEAANTMRQMLQEITENKNLADQEKSEEFARVMKEAEKIQSEGMRRMIGIEKFKFELYMLLKKEGLLPNKKSEFVLKRNVCTIDGKKLPEEIHDRILKLSEETIGKKFDKDSKIILQLNENR